MSFHQWCCFLFIYLQVVYPTIGMEYYSFKCTVGCCYDKGVWWKKASLYVHSLKITKLSKWFFVLMQQFMSATPEQFIVVHLPHTKKNCVFLRLLESSFGVCLDKSLRGFCNFNKLWLVILHYMAVFIENLGC